MYSYTSTQTLCCHLEVEVWIILHRSLNTIRKDLLT